MSAISANVYFAAFRTPKNSQYEFSPSWYSSELELVPFLQLAIHLVMERQTQMI
jgi:hypothetical protein